MNIGLKLETQFKVPPSVFKNGTAMLDFIVKSHKMSKIYSNQIDIAAHRQPVPKAFNLVATKENEPVRNPLQPTTHWLSRLQVFVLKDAISFPVNEVPLELSPIFHAFKKKSSLIYSPLIYANPQLQPTFYWTELPKEPTEKLNFTLEVVPLSIGKFRLRCILAQAAEQLKSMGVKDKDIEDIQGIFTETNLYLLITTIVVSAFHLFFDFLAFKNDVHFWRNTENTSGISIRTVIWRCISTSIIFLYLYEEKSSMLVVVPAGISMVIEYWKLCRMAKVTFTFRSGISVGQRSKEEKETDELDANFMRCLLLLMVPLCIGGAIYSLLYMPHKSWRSWILQTAVNGVYALYPVDHSRVNEFGQRGTAEDEKENRTSTGSKKGSSGKLKTN
nr:cleft lip and palate transmembrane protein [Hymenolepis microstoma]